jgi:ubiquinone/menaquinone biosynthesis C-methylase UbiE
VRTSAQGEKQSVEAFYDQIAPAYDQRYEKNAFFTKVYEPLTWHNIQRFLPPPGGRILDAGGGTGRWTIPLAQMGYRVALTDISAGMLEIAQHKLVAQGLLDRVTTYRMDVCDMQGLPDEHYDLAMALGDPLSYCQDPDRAVAELARVTRPGGRVIGSVDSRMKAVRAMTEGNWNLAQRILTSGEMPWRGDDAALAFPIHAFTVGELQTLFELRGLRVVRVLGKPVFFPWLPPDVQQRVLEKEEDLAQLIELESRYADDPGWAGSAARFDIVGVKE